MSRLIYPTEEQMNVLMELGLLEPGASIIVSPEMAELAKQEDLPLQAVARGYDHGGDADIWVDIVTSEDTLLFEEARLLKERRETSKKEKAA